MKGAILLVLLTFSSVVSATTYYVATTGKDSNPGTISQPWLTWQKAFSTANAGDIVYFRGGIYRPAAAAYWNNITMIDPNDGIGHNGTKANPICYYNYPGEAPILDCSLIRSSGNFNTGINIDNAEFINFKGLTVRNVYQHTSNVSVCGINVYNCSNFIFENMSVHNLGGRAFYYESSAWQGSIAYDTTRFINCDMYNCLDSLGYAPGNMADGIKGHMYPKCYTYFEGCRVWHCSDDGFDLSGSGVAVFNKCWAWDMGYLDVGNGSGFKIGAIGDSVSYPTRIVTNCLAAWCTNSIGVASGFGEIDYYLDPSSYYRVNARIYNNTAYKNDLGFSAGTHPNKNFRNSIYRNNISYMSGFIQDGVRYNVLLMSYLYPESHNTWDFHDPSPGSMPPWFVETDTVTVTDADFVTVDSTGISGPRKSDGSLPDINFLKLRSTSDLIDAGTQIPSSDGVDFLLQYSGLSPDIGYAEYSGTNTIPKPVTSITVTGAGGATTITTNRGTLQLLAAILPSDASNKTVKWSIANGTGQATINSTGLVTAAANGTVTAKATANDGSGVYGTLTITISNQAIAVTGITVTGASGATTITTDNGTLQLSAAVLPANATNKAVTWSLTNGTGQGTINSTGLVTAVANGTVTARATANDGSGIYGTLTITISNQVIAVTGITVTGASGATTITTNNGTLQLSAAVLPANATNKTVTWSLTNGTGQATINSTGLVTAAANGTVTARATANDGSGVYGTLTITISNQAISVTGITVTGAGGATTITTDNGTLQLSATVLPANATNKTVTWSLTNGTGQGTINSTGLVTAVANGTVTARATANDGSGVYGTLTITISNQVTAVTGITVTGAGGATLITTIGGTLQLSAAVLPANATNKTVTWSLTNGTGQGTINSTGLVTAAANGTVTARATANDGSGVYGTLTITISNQVTAVTGITVTGASGATTITTDKGTLQLSVTVLPANATNKTVTWSLANGTGQGTINSTGLVTAAANGTITARATASDGSGVYGTLTITISNQVIAVTDIIVTGAGGTTTITIDNGTLQLSAAVLPANATNKGVTWSISSGSDKASISSTGLVTALDNGTAIARVTANDGSGVYGTLTITISNQVIIVNTPPVIVINYNSTSYSGFVSEIDASGSYDVNNDNLVFSWIVPNNVPVSSITDSRIKYLGPVVSTAKTYDFTLNITDGKTTLSKVFPIEIHPYKPELEVAEISNVEASNFQSPYFPYNIIDGNIGTMWAADGDDQWLIIELKHSFLVQHVKLAFQPGQRRESYFDILGSVDKVIWEPILNKSASCAFSGDLQVFEFPPSKTGKVFNYIKVIGLGNSTDTWNYISELKIFGYRYRNSHDYEKLPVKIYPNPAKEHLTLRIDEPTLTPDFIQITEISGAVIMRDEVDPDIRELTIPLDLKNGIYIIQLGSGKLTLFTQKLVVSK